MTNPSAQTMPSDAAMRAAVDLEIQMACQTITTRGLALHLDKIAAALPRAASAPAAVREARTYKGPNRRAREVLTKCFGAEFADQHPRELELIACEIGLAELAAPASTGDQK